MQGAVNILVRTEEFAQWLVQLRDVKGKARILARQLKE